MVCTWFNLQNKPQKLFHDVNVRKKIRFNLHKKLQTSLKLIKTCLFIEKRSYAVHHQITCKQNYTMFDMLL